MAPIWRHFNRRLFLSVTLIAFSQFGYGLDNQGFSSTQATNAFAAQFGTFDAKTKTYILQPYWLSLFNSCPYVGFAIGLVAGSLVSARWGRRASMFGMSLWALVSATIIVTAQTPGQIMAGRILNYVYIGCELSTVPIFQAEIAPQAVRGFVVSTYQLSIGLGGLIINSVVRGTSVFNDRRAYLIPYCLFYVVPVIVASLIWTIPESPRWLMTKNRMDEARVNHKLYREGTMSDEAIEKEFQQLHEALLNEPEQGRTSELFKGYDLKRTLIVVTMNAFQQATGQAFISQYGALFIKSLGTNPFTITVINACCGIFTGFLAMSLSDRVGRRRLLQLSALIQAGGLFTMGGLGLQSPASSSHKAGEVAMVIVSINGFLLGWAPLTYVVSAEIPALRLRDRTQRAGMLTNIFFNWLVNFIVPYLLNPPYADLQGRVGFIFGSITVLSMLFTFFCVPECKNRSLEEIDIMFQTGVPIRAFRNHTHIAIEVDADKADVDPESPRDRQAAFDEKDAKATTMERDTSEKE